VRVPRLAFSTRAFVIFLAITIPPRSGCSATHFPRIFSGWKSWYKTANMRRTDRGWLSAGRQDLADPLVKLSSYEWEQLL
jgi:hypothetical protein